MKRCTFLLYFLLLAASAFSQNDSPALIDSLHRALQTATDTNRILVLQELAIDYAFYKPDSAFYYAGTGLQLAQKLQYKEGIALCYLRLAACFRSTNSSAEAMQYARKALPLFEETKDVDRIVTSNLMMNWVYYDQQEDDSAFAYTRKATRLAIPANSYMTYWCYTSFMDLYKRRNELDSAIVFAKKADSVSHRVSPLQTLAEIYTEKQDTANAIKCYKEALALKENFMDKAHIAQLEGKKDSAAFYAKKMLGDAQQRKYLKDVASSSALLFTIYSSQHKSDSALKYILIAQRAKDSLFNKDKARQFQTAVFSETLHRQEMITQQQNSDNLHKIYTLLAAAAITLLVAFFLYRSNRQKQKTNTLLHKQKQKIESTLAELKATQQQLIQSEKMASLGELTAGIAHEIQNPLNFVNNFSEVNKEMIDEATEEINKGDLEEAKNILHDIKDNSEKISHHGRRADAIVKGMLQHSRQTKGVKEPTDINALCDEYLRLSYHGLRAKDKTFNADFTTEFDNSIGNIHIVPQDMGRVLLNLFNNAFYAVNQKKKSEGGEHYKPLVSVNTKKANNKIEIIVTDNGNGIPQTIINKIFQPFFTTKPTGEGTGLGLSLSYDIVTKQHNGTLQVQSEEGKGSRFTILLPL